MREKEERSSPRWEEVGVARILTFPFQAGINVFLGKFANMGREGGRKKKYAGKSK